VWGGLEMQRSKSCVLESEVITVRTHGQSESLIIKITDTHPQHLLTADTPRSSSALTLPTTVDNCPIREGSPTTSEKIFVFFSVFSKRRKMTKKRRGKHGKKTMASCSDRLYVSRRFGRIHTNHNRSRSWHTQGGQNIDYYWRVELLYLLQRAIIGESMEFFNRSRLLFMKRRDFCSLRLAFGILLRRILDMIDL
jgi:hypothetical protein